MIARYACASVLMLLALSACSTPRKPQPAIASPTVAVIKDLEVEFRSVLVGTPAEVLRQSRRLRIVLPARLLFMTDTATMAPDAAATLAAMLQLLAAPSGLYVNLNAHTDSIGSHAFNEEFSRQRAAAMRLWLITHGVPQDMLEAHGKGETTPLTDNETPAGRERNRRVELIVGAR